jgi:hypothetical protein
MRLHFLLLGLVAGLEVLALDAATPWEMQYFYAAYKAEWLAGLDGSQRQIATQCKRSTTHPFPSSDFDTQAALAGVTGMCSFDDFVKHVGTDETFRRYIYTAEGNMWNIDQYWKTLMDKFNLYRMPGSAKELRYAYDFQKLLPKGGFSDRLNAYPPAIAGVANALQTARDTVAALPNQDDDGVKAKVAAVEAQAANAKEYSRVTQGVRTADSVRYPPMTVNQYLRTTAGSAFTLWNKDPVAVKPPAPYDTEAFNVVTYNNEVDFDKTLTTNAAGADNGTKGPQKNAFKRFFAAGQAQFADIIRNHANVIQAYKQVVDLVTKNKAGCRLTAVPRPAKKRDLGLSGERQWPEFYGESSNQSDLLEGDLKFKDRTVIVPGQSVSHLVRMGEASV